MTSNNNLRFLSKETTESFREKYPPQSVKNKGHLFESVFSFEVKSDLDTLFKTLTNTSLVNKKLQVPDRFEEESNGSLFISSKILGMKSRWEEKPWRWIYGDYIIADRVHEYGPLITEHAVIQVSPVQELSNHYRVYFYYFAEMRFKFVQLLYLLGFKFFGKKLAEVVESLVNNPHKIVKAGLDDPLSQQTFLKFHEMGIPDHIAKNMAALMYHSDDDDVYKIQLPLLSKEWDVPIEELIKAFLKASYHKFFLISWDVICPHCKGTRSQFKHLQDLLEHNSCEPCQLDFQLNSLDLIDATFKINPEYRVVKEVTYCAAEPFKKVHMFTQEKLLPDERQSFLLNLKSGEYRLRILGHKQQLSIHVSCSDSVGIHWDCKDSKKLTHVGSHINISIHNSLEQSITYILEAIITPQNYLSPLTIFNEKLFKKLYTTESLPAGVQLRLPVQILFFTDIVDSTKFYQKVGDVKAYKQIKGHFDIISDVLDKHNGIIIKTIGDAVMATFKDPINVIEATKSIISEVEQAPHLDFKLRFSVHHGEVIAVNFNTGLDYFGDSVNVSAKLQGIANANELAMSEDFLESLGEYKKQFETIKRTYLTDREGHVIHFN